MRSKKIPKKIGAWGVIPQWIMEHKRLTALAKLLTAALAMYEGPQGIFPSLKTLASTVAATKRGVAKALKLLEREFIVRVESRHNTKGKQVSNKYRLDLTHPNNRIPMPKDVPDGFWERD